MLISQWRIKRMCLFVGGLLIAGASLYIYWAQNYRSCSNEKHQRFIEEMCTMYHNHTIVGNMCSKVCDEKYNVRYDHCGNNNWGKNVIILKCKTCDTHRPNINIVLKCEPDMREWEHYVNLDFARNKSLEDIVSTVKARTKTAFHLDLPKVTDLMRFLWNENFDTFAQKERFENSSRIAALNVLGLGLQLEYISLKYLENQSYMPKLYGTCGPAYFVEYTPSFSALGLVLFQGKMPELLHLRQRFPTWKERVNVALKLLQLIRILDTQFASSLHHCDIKPHNFGINDKNEVVMLDTDYIGFGNSMDARACQSDLDCEWVNCEGICNMTSRTCLHTLKNTNLKRLCNDVFLSHIARFGLLRNAPRKISRYLTDALQECAFPSQYDTDVTVNRSNNEMINKLESILLSS